MRTLMIALTTLSVLVAACSRSHKLSDQLNGTWVNNLISDTVDLPNHKITTIIMGEQPTTNQGLEVVSEQANVVVIKALGDVTGKPFTVVIQFQDKDHITWTMQGENGGVPFFLHRYKPTS